MELTDEEKRWKMGLTKEDIDYIKNILEARESKVHDELSDISYSCDGGTAIRRIELNKEYYLIQHLIRYTKAKEVK